MPKIDTDKATNILGVVTAASMLAGSYGVQPELTSFIQAGAILGLSYLTNKK